MQVELKLDQDRMADVLTVDRIIAITDVLSVFYEVSKNGISDLSVLLGFGQNVRQLRDFICDFVWKNGAYLSIEEARPIVGQMSLKQLISSAQSLVGNAEEVAIPEALGGTSDSDSNAA